MLRCRGLASLDRQSKLLVAGAEAGGRNRSVEAGELGSDAVLHRSAERQQRQSVHGLRRHKAIAQFCAGGAALLVAAHVSAELGHGHLRFLVLPATVVRLLRTGPESLRSPRNRRWQPVGWQQQRQNESADDVVR